VLELLGDGKRKCKRIDTHAYRISGRRSSAQGQTAVRLSFLDYSALQKRKRACDDVINRPFAPQPAPET
jgi:aminoglycoside phosphotransferase family enzyme